VAPWTTATCYGGGRRRRPSSTTAGPVFVATRDNMLVSGGTATGKTMLPMRWCLRPEDRLVLVEDHRT
jgi:hypothetical protein